MSMFSEKLEQLCAKTQNCQALRALAPPLSLSLTKKEKNCSVTPHHKCHIVQLAAPCKSTMAVGQYKHHFTIT